MLAHSRNLHRGNDHNNVRNDLVGNLRCPINIRLSSNLSRRSTGRMLSDILNPAPMPRFGTLHV